MKGVIMNKYERMWKSLKELVEKGYSFSATHESERGKGIHDGYGLVRQSIQFCEELYEDRK